MSIHPAVHLHTNCAIPVLTFIKLTTLKTSKVLCRIIIKKRSGFEPANELYRLRGHWSAKLVPTFEGRGVSRGQRNGSHGP
jgi:hypothetical protein